MNVNLNMLRATMMNWIGSHVDRADIVAIDNGRRRDRDMKGSRYEAPQAAGATSNTQQLREQQLGTPPLH